MDDQLFYDEMKWCKQLDVSDSESDDDDNESSDDESDNESDNENNSVETFESFIDKCFNVVIVIIFVLLSFYYLSL